MENRRLAERVWSMVRMDGAFECWPWFGTLTKRGYGRTKLVGTTERLAHRIVWTLVNGPIPTGMCVLHRCDNPPCCNPAHLWLGTQADNVADREQKGRNVVRRGHLHRQAKLTEKQVIAARNDPRGCTTVARDLGVTEQTIWKIRSGKWGGLPKSNVPRKWVRNPGERNAAAKLTEADVLAIRADPRVARVVAAEYGLAMGHVHRIRQRKGWTHI